MTTEARPPRRPSRVARRLVCACLLLLAYPQVAHANDQKQILLFHYYGADMPFKAEFDPSFARTLRNESPAPVTLYEEVLETYRFTGEAQETNVVNYLRQKYSGRKIDVVVAVLDPALIFLMRHRDQLFTGVPVVGVLAKKANPPIDFPLAGGVLLGTQMKNRVDVPLALQPTLRHLFVVEGALENTGHTEAQLREQFKPFEGHLALIYLRDLPLPEVIARVRAAPPDSAVLFVRQLRGTGSEATDQLQALSRRVRASPVPVYGVSSPVLGQGIIGGFLTDYERVGHQTAQLTLQAAAGPPSAADVSWVEAPGVPMFDWRELKRWGISEGLLPAGSVVRFREPSIWDYRALVFGALAFLVAQSAVIAALIVQHERRRRAEDLSHGQRSPPQPRHERGARRCLGLESRNERDVHRSAPQAAPGVRGSRDSQSVRRLDRARASGRPFALRVHGAGARRWSVADLRARAPEGAQGRQRPLVPGARLNDRRHGQADAHGGYQHRHHRAQARGRGAGGLPRPNPRVSRDG